MPHATMRDGCALYYELHGDASHPALLYCPASGSDLRKSPNISHTPLGRRFRILAYDVRGTGRSDRPAGSWPAPSVDALADDAADLLDAVGWESCAVLGCSFGGMVALHLALARPQAVHTLALVCVSAGERGGASAPTLTETLEPLSSDERAARMVALADVRRDDAWFAAEQGRALVAFAASADAQFRNEPGAAEGRAWLYRARRSYDAEGALETRGGRLAARVLVLAGQHDGLVTPESASALHAAIARARALGAGSAARSRLEQLDAGHWPSIAMDKRFWPLLSDFLARADDGLAPSAVGA